MKNYFTAAVLLASTVLHSQQTNFDPLSVELNFGLTNPVQPVAPGYDARTLSPFSVSLGGRYMFNQNFGIRLTSAFHQFKNSPDYNVFKTNYLRTNIEALVNAGNVLHFYDWTKRFGILLHTGAGYSIMKEKSWTKDADEMMNFIFGVSPLVKVNERISLLVDFSALAHIYQSRTYDFTQANLKRGTDGFLFNFSVGINYTFGSKTPADWYVPTNLLNELSLLTNKIDSLKLEKLDDDADGVANYLDQEPLTAPNAIVNTKGITTDNSAADQDGDGVPNSTDECPFEKGTIGAKGCPDYDEDSVADRWDDCPFLVGSLVDKGCPEIPENIKKALVSTQNSLKFTAKKSDITVEAKLQLQNLASELKYHPEMKLVINAHVVSSGDPLFDLKLSQERAYSIRYYLVGLGIPNERLIALGLGMTQPISTLENSVNERVELKIKF